MTCARARLAIVAIAMAYAPGAVADEPAPEPTPAPSEPTEPALREPDPVVMARIRELYTRRDYAGVERELLAEHARTEHPSLLFALGQVALALERYAAAIDYYERFIATGPGEEQVSLAQQAIGAARIQLARPRPRPPIPPEPRRREWYRSDTVLIAGSGLIAAAGTAALLYGRHLGNDRSGTLAAYDARVDRAHVYRWTGIGLSAGGAIAAGITLLRWRLRPDDGDGATARGWIDVAASGSGLSVFVSRPW